MVPYLFLQIPDEGESPEPAANYQKLYLQLWRFTSDPTLV